jgi:class 3 adenylate cyclase
MTKSLQEWARPNTKLVALVFTDIVDSTSLGNSLGDEKWIALLRKHFDRARFLMWTLDCCEIKIIGDSFMVVFRSVLEALDFALAFNKDTGSPEIKIRVGIHVGPVRVIDNDIFGIMVNYTKRVESAFSVSGIVISSEAKTHIDYEKATRHSTIIFKSYKARFKGFDAPQTLWRVRTPEDTIRDLFSPATLKKN